MGEGFTIHSVHESWPAFTIVNPGGGGGHSHFTRCTHPDHPSQLSTMNCESSILVGGRGRMI